MVIKPLQEGTWSPSEALVLNMDRLFVKGSMYKVFGRSVSSATGCSVS